MSAKEISDDDLIASLRKAGSIWFRNTDLLLLEELIRRLKEAQSANNPPR